MSITPHPHLHHAVLSVLAAQGFSRSSATALNTTTDILSRYIALLAKGAAQQAQNAGRSGISILDLVIALEETGMEVGELQEYAGVEGRLPLRQQSAAEREALEGWKDHLQDGLFNDSSDRVPLVYGIVPTPDSSASSPLTELSSSSNSPLSNHQDLLPSPVSMSPPDSPPPKRPKHVSWNPPDHIPEFLPPFPGEVPASLEGPEAVETEPFELTFIEEEDIKPSMVQSPRPVASFHAPTPYATSTVSDVSRSHLPPSPSTTPPPSPPSINSAFASALHVIKTGDNPITFPSHGVATHSLANLVTNLSARRYDAPDTLFGASEPPLARHAAPTPTHPTPLNPATTLPVPPPATRSINSQPPASPAPPYLFPILPELTKAVLPQSLYDRIERLNPPPLLQNNEQFLYGRPVPAPWNGHFVMGANGEKQLRVEDAQLSATWEYHPRDYKENLGAKRMRAQSFSLQPKREGR